MPGLTTAYLVTSTVTVPIAGKLGDLFDRKPFHPRQDSRVHGHEAGSAGSARTCSELIIFRAAQGLFGGVLFASVFTVLADIFSPRCGARMRGVFGGVFGLASVIGPAAGGRASPTTGAGAGSSTSNIPVSVLGIALLFAFLPLRSQQGDVARHRLAGAFLMVAGLVPVLISLSTQAPMAGAPGRPSCR